MISTSIGIVTYNNEAEIGALLKSIFKYTKDIHFQIYVVDNASTDNTVRIIKENYPAVKVLAMKKNLGFGAGHNQLIPYIHSDYHVIVNPDIQLCSNAIADLAGYLNGNPDVALVGPKILNADGTEQHLPKQKPKLRYLLSGRLEKHSRFFNELRADYTLMNRREDEPIEIDFSSGCFMVIRTAVYKQIEGFDEQFFLYLEDADLTLRAKAYGRVVFYPAVSVIHSWKRASAKKTKYFFIHINSMRKFMWKWRKK